MANNFTSVQYFLIFWQGTVGERDDILPGERSINHLVDLHISHLNRQVEWNAMAKAEVSSQGSGEACLLFKTLNRLPNEELSNSWEY